MTPRARTVLLAFAGLVLLGPVARVALALPGFGAPSATRYADAVNALGPAERHAANEVSAVNFDVRGFDTLGEEFMLLSAVTGAVLLLRGGRGEDLTAKAGRLEGRSHELRSDAVILVSRLLGPLILLFGLYVALHVTVTPGGGFQGGVIGASGLLLIYLGEGYVVWRRLVRSKVMDAIEGGGALLFALAALAAVALGLPVLENILPLGTFKDMLSGGLMLIENAGVFLAVAGGFGQLFIEFLEETRAAKSEVEE